MKNVLIVGAGRAGKALVEKLNLAEGFCIQGVLDKNPDAPGIELAESLGIPTASDWKKFCGNNSFDTIIDVSGGKEITQALLESRPDGVEFINGSSAELMELLLDQLDKAEEANKQNQNELEMQEWGLNKTNQGIKILYKELEEKKQQSEAANQAKSVFLANMSHELRTPLNAIIGFSHLLVETSLDHVQKDYANTIIDSGRVLLDLINDILDISKIEAGKISLECIAFNLPNLIESVVKIISSRLGDKKIKLYHRIDKDLSTTFNGDPIRLKQVLFNLLCNAVKFTDNGEIRLAVKSKGGRTKPVSGKQKGCTLEFSVKDTGIGIPKDKQKIIFKPFSQAETSTKRIYGGTGLGLTISQSLIKQMGGKIRVKSEVGKGSDFIFTVQLKEAACLSKSNIAESRLSPKLAISKGPLLEGLKVLVAEDNPTNQKLINRMLVNFGCQVDLVVNGKDAVEQVEKGEYDMIILDVQMPIMGGVEAALAIRQKKQEIPIIALTAAASKEDVDKCFSAGMSDFLSKPVDPDRLIGKLLKWKK